MMINMSQITKVYNTGNVAFEALRGIDLDVADNEYIAIVGPSGSGVGGRPYQVVAGHRRQG